MSDETEACFAWLSQDNSDLFQPGIFPISVAIVVLYAILMSSIVVTWGHEFLQW